MVRPRPHGHRATCTQYEILVRNEETVKDLIRSLSTQKNIVVNIYYQVIGNIENSTVSGVNTVTEK